MSAGESIEQHLQILEKQLLRLDVRKRAAELDALLAREFVEFGSSGRIFDKYQTIETLRAEPPIHRSLLDFKVVLLAPDVALATYRAIRYGAAGEPLSQSLRSSVWRVIDGRWQMVFHQGTPSAEIDGAQT